MTKAQIRAASKRLTKWEAGNELVRAADVLSNVSAELKDWPEMQKAVKEARKIIKEHFEDADLVEEMGFGI